MAIRDEIRTRFQGNIDRVKNVVGVYRSSSRKGKGPQAVRDIVARSLLPVRTSVAWIDTVERFGRLCSPNSDAKFS